MILALTQHEVELVRQGKRGEVIRRLMQRLNLGLMKAAEMVKQEEEVQRAIGGGC